MRICIVNPFYDASAATYLEVTGRYRHVESLAAALARCGHDVTVIQGFYEGRIEQRGMIRFHYVETPQRSPFRLSGGVLGIDLISSASLQNIVGALEQAQPDAVHMNGITLLGPLVAIGRWSAEARRPLTVSHHGGVPRRLPWLRRAHRRALAVCKGALFTAQAHAEPWISAGVLPRDKVVMCLEVSSTFMPTDKRAARERTKMHGDPVFVWNARLHKDKDPLTALRGFARIRAQWQGARLYMIYLSSEMLSDVRETLQALHVGHAVELRGRIPHHEVEAFLNSADFIIQSSQREVAGYSIVEAMACGVVPILTSIPSFRAMTDNGRVGVLFPPSDYEAMTRGVLSLDLANLQVPSQKVREFFTRSLSYEAIAAIYERALAGPPRAVP
jgi:glycosyltransferase involved in cell wall biosynthesis